MPMEYRDCLEKSEEDLLTTAERERAEVVTRPSVARNEVEGD